MVEKNKYGHSQVGGHNSQIQGIHHGKNGKCSIFALSASQVLEALAMSSSNPIPMGTTRQHNQPNLSLFCFSSKKTKNKQKQMTRIGSRYE